MWRVLRELGGYGGAAPTYDPESAEIRADRLPLDPIDCAGALRISSLRKNSRFPIQDFAATAFSFCMDEKNFQRDFTLDTFRLERTSTAEKWRSHLRSLALFMILIPVTWGDVRGCATYFAVPKDPTCSRSIFNGRRMSLMMRTPNPVNLPYLPQILEKIGGYEGAKTMLCADIRHWFHQIPIHQNISRFFCVGSGGEFYRWATLPMGISWAPFVAQSVGWALLLESSRDGGWLYDLPREYRLEQPPAFLELKGGGFVCLFYDNIFAIGDPEVICRLKNHWFHERTGVFARYNVTLKEIEERLPGDRRPINYLGASIERHRKRIRNRDGGRQNIYQTFWKQRPDKLEAWRAFCLGLCQRALSYREVSRLCGRFLWRQSLTLRPLCDFTRIIDIIKRSAHERLEKSKTWDETCDLSETERKTLDEYAQEMLANPIMTAVKCDAPRERITVCSDSSDNGWGYVILHEGSYESFPYEWTAAEARMHIFLKELLAAIRCIQATIRGPSIIRIGIDNTAAAHAIRNMYSSNSAANVFLRDLRESLLQSNSIVEVVSLRSKENAADGPSRSRMATEKEVADTRVALSRKQLEDEEKGLRSNAYEEEEREQRDLVRHRDCNENDAEDEDCLSALLTHDEVEARPSTQSDDPHVGDSGAL